MNVIDSGDRDTATPLEGSESVDLARQSQTSNPMDNAIARPMRPVLPRIESSRIGVERTGAEVVSSPLCRTTVVS